MPGLPTGTITFLFTDVEGSARLWEQSPGAMRQAMARHDTVVEDGVVRYGGAVVRPRGEGDSRFAVFARAGDALAAACALQRALVTEPWPTPAPLRVRMAVHTGEGELRAGDYYGPAVNRCARLRALAHGGQTLLSRATVELVRDTLPESVSLRSLGVHRLRDLQRPEEVFQLLHPNLPPDFPPLQSLDAFPHNLPIQLTSFVGREQEIRDVARLLGSSHLLTLTGPGGCGKTRLGLQVAAIVQDEMPDGVWLVQLGALTDPTFVPEAVAGVLGVREEPKRPFQATLADYLHFRHVLLVLDNCEHVVAACAQLAGGLLSACPHLRILATSQEALGIAGEWIWRVPPLAVPDPQRLPPLDALAQYEAIRLFLDRAATVMPGFAVTADNAHAIVEICRRLEGIPLAIELAATRIKALPVEEIAARLGDRFRLLTGGNRTALPRHQTLWAAMDWSYQLLDDSERAVLLRLSVFAGSWSLRGAERVCAGNGTAEDAVLGILFQLVAKSLVMREITPGTEGRYRLLETMRHYCQKKLLESDPAERVRRRQLDFYLDLVERAEPQLWGAEQALWLDRLELEHDNLRVVLEWAAESAPERALRLAGGLWRFWDMRGYLSEGRGWLERLLDAMAADSSHAAIRAKALNGAGVLARGQGDYLRATGLHREALALRRELGDKRGIAAVLNNLGVVAKEQGNYAQAIALHEEALAMRRELGDQWGIAASLNSLAVIAQEQGDYDGATAWYEQGLVLLRRLDDKHGIAVVLNNLANVAFARGDYPRAEAIHKEALALFRELGNRRGMAISLDNLATVALRRGQLSQAVLRSRDSLILRREIGDKPGIAACLEVLAGVTCAQGEFGRAARLLGGAEGVRDASGSALTPSEREDHDRLVVAVRAGGGADVFAETLAAGRAMTLEEAIEYALLGDSTSPTPDEKRNTGASSLKNDSLSRGK